MKEQSKEYIDFATLRIHMANYDALFLRLLELFLEQAPLWIEELGEAFARQDPTLVRQICHKIKGGAGTLQAQPILEAAADLSRHAVAGDLTNAKESLNRLISTIEDTVAFILASGHIKTKC